MNLTKDCCELRCSGKATSSCSISATYHVTFVRNLLMISHERGMKYYGCYSDYFREIFTAEVQSSEVTETCPMTFTSNIVKGVLSRLDLLLQVNIEPQSGMSYSRNLSMMDPTQIDTVNREILV